MQRLAIIVEFEIAPLRMDEFRNLVKDNAQKTISLEGGCRIFEVLEPVGFDNRFLLYEVYDSDRDFENHLASSHFLTFDEAARHLVERKTVKRLRFS
jgi:quinol monooxygenase YgiN